MVRVPPRLGAWGEGPSLGLGAGGEGLDAWGEDPSFRHKG